MILMICKLGGEVAFDQEITWLTEREVTALREYWESEGYTVNIR